MILKSKSDKCEGHTHFCHFDLKENRLNCLSTFSYESIFEENNSGKYQ